MEEMDELLDYGVERLSGVLKENLNTKAAFKSIAGIIEEASRAIAEGDKGTMETLIRELG